VRLDDLLETVADIDCRVVTDTIARRLASIPDATAAPAIAERIQGIPSVVKARWEPVAGTFLVTYRPDTVSASDLRRQLRAWEWATDDLAASRNASREECRATMQAWLCHRGLLPGDKAGVFRSLGPRAPRAPGRRRDQRRPGACRRRRGHRPGHRHGCRHGHGRDHAHERRPARRSAVLRLNRRTLG
jgi:hypothetical protein